MKFRPDGKFRGTIFKFEKKLPGAGVRMISGPEIYITKIYFWKEVK